MLCRPVLSVATRSALYGGLPVSILSASHSEQKTNAVLYCCPISSVFSLSLATACQEGLFPIGRQAPGGAITTGQELLMQLLMWGQEGTAGKRVLVA